MLGIIIQARLGSTRLPGKILKKIYRDQTVFDLLLDNLKTLTNKIVIATTNNKSDIPITKLAQNHGLDYYCGDEFNILNRYIECAKEFNFSKIIRITSDNIFIQPSLIKPLIKKENSNFDYISYKIFDTNVVLTHWGFFGEYVTLNALQKVEKKTKEKLDLEHVTLYIYNHPNEFNLKYLEVPEELERLDLRLTIDTIDDFEICKNIVNYLKINELDWHFKNILTYLNENPKIKEKMRKNIEKMQRSKLSFKN